MSASASEEDEQSADNAAVHAAPSEMAPGGIGFKARLAEIDDRIRRNADVLSLIVDDSRGFFSEAGGAESEAERDGSGSGSDVGNASVSEGGPHTHNGQARTAEPGMTAPRQGAAQHGADPRRRRRVADQDLDKIRSTIKQLVRDWSDEVGGPCCQTLCVSADRQRRRAAPSERQRTARCSMRSMRASALSQQQIGEARNVPVLLRCIADSPCRPAVRVLVPGAGLGRLAFEVAWQGYSCQGNEYSFFMLLASHVRRRAATGVRVLLTVCAHQWILNKSSRRHEHIIYPYVHSSSNWRTAQDMLQGVRIPECVL